MDNLTPYCYKALNADSYNALAAQIVTSNLDASFFPRLLTIVVTPKKDDEDAFLGIGKFIDTEGLSCLINPIILHNECRGDLIDNEITPPSILRTIILEVLDEKAHNADISASLQARLDTCEQTLASVRADKESCYQWWQDESRKRTRLEDSLKALRTLLNTVVE